MIPDARSQMAMLLTVVYVLIIMSPLAPLALSSAVIAHAVSGQCAGDCAICGCSPELSAKHACCCWEKKQHEQERERQRRACCEKDSGGKTVLSCGCPCGGNKPLAFLDRDNVEQFPYRFTEEIPALCADAPSSPLPERLLTRKGDPPDPPPKLPAFC
jgi:hypothetical protein